MLWLLVTAATAQEPFTLTAAQLQNGQAIELDKLGWKYSPHDDPRFADPQFDDRAWETLKDSATPHESRSRWSGRGCFRLHLQVAPELSTLTLNLELHHLGASEVYLDGNRIKSFGVIGKNLAEEAAYNPNAEPVALSFQPKTEHILVVRYSNHQTAASGAFLSQWLVKMSSLLASSIGIGGTGFRSRIKLLGSNTNQGYNPTFNTFTYVTFQGTVYLSFGILHLLFFAFFSRQRSNLFSGLFLSGVGLNAFFVAVLIAGHYGLSGLYWYWHLGYIAGMFQAVAWLAFLSTAFKPRFPKIVWVFFAGAIFLTTASLFGGAKIVELGNSVFALVFTLEALRIMFSAIRRRCRGAWIIGAAVFLGGISNLQVFIYPVFRFPDGLSTTLDILSFYGLIFALTVYLAREFAHTNENLEEQLVQVKLLSTAALEHEKVKAEHDRKTKELEEARQLQLSMLPKKLPNLPNLDLAAYMQTASEVGGDYYDVHLGDDGTLTVAIGDATGHGLKAGTMVAAVKSLFVTLAYHPDIPHIFTRMSQTLKQMQMRGVFMALALVKYHERRATIAIAGMPSPLVFRSATNTIERIPLTGLPLGGVTSYRYREMTTAMQPGDVLLLLSDGLTECFNPADEMFGEARVEQCLQACAQMKPDEIITRLLAAAEAWAEGRKLEDDLTLVVLKAK